MWGWGWVEYRVPGVKEKQQHVRPPKPFGPEFRQDGPYCPLVRHRNGRTKKTQKVLVPRANHRRIN